MRCAGCMPKLLLSSRSRSATLMAALSSCATSKPLASTSSRRPNSVRGSQRCRPRGAARVHGAVDRLQAPSFATGTEST